MQFTYKKNEKLKSRKQIKQLFENGKAVTVFPLRLIYLKTDFEGENSIKSSVSVSKRNFKLAVHRNKIKRLMREAYRLNKPFLYQNVKHKYIFMFIYLDKKEQSFEIIHKKMKIVMTAFLEKIKS